MAITSVPSPAWGQQECRAVRGAQCVWRGLRGRGEQVMPCLSLCYLNPLLVKARPETSK